MRTRLRILLLSVLAAVSFVLAPPTTGADGLPQADGPCTNGTNWDDATQTCK